MVAECLGALTTMHSDSLVPVLRSMAERAVQEEKALGLWTLVSSLRFSFSVSSPAALSLASTFEQFLPLLLSTDLEVQLISIFLQ